jgi:Domain of unknown function (DUF1707)
MPLSRSDRIQSALWRLRWGGTLIGDQQREKVTDYLSLAHSEGFIDREDFDRRTDLALSARYDYELEWAKDELPTDIRPRPKPTPPFNPNTDLIDYDDGPGWWLFAMPIVAGLCLIGWMVFALVQITSLPHG